MPPRSMMLGSRAARVIPVDQSTISLWAKKGQIGHARPDGRLWVDAAPVKLIAGTLPLAQVARKLNVGKSVLWDLIRAGRLAAARTPGGHYRLRPEVVEELAWLHPGPDVLTTKQAADLAGVHPRRIRAWMRDEVLTHHTGRRGHPLFAREQVEQVARIEEDLLSPGQACAAFGFKSWELLELSYLQPQVVGRFTQGGYRRYSRTRLRALLT